MAKPNYAYEKRQRELAKQQKKRDKERARTARKEETPSDAPAPDGMGGAPSAATIAPIPD